MRIDAHQHFWIYNAERDAWINDDMAAIHRDFMPTDLAPVLRQSSIDGVISVQASQSPEETQLLVDLSTMYAMVKGVVGWVDLQGDNLAVELEEYKKTTIIKGFRHVIEGEEDPDFLMRPAFLSGIKQLTAHGYTYDLLIRPRHYASTLACVKANPEQVFILDHMAKPNIKTGDFDEWAAFITELASFPNVNCKISGLVTEADWKNWKPEDFVKYVDHAIASFGKERILYGSDWPVCLVAATYEEWVKLVDSLLVDFTDDEKKAFWGGNAVRIYKV